MHNLKQKPSVVQRIVSGKIHEAYINERRINKIKTKWKLETGTHEAPCKCLAKNKNKKTPRK